MAVDREIAGRCTCPICGAPAQDVRVNVNQKLYGYCDNGCSFKFNSVQSKQFLPQLRAGRSVATANGITIFSTKKGTLENAENKEHGADYRRNINAAAARDTAAGAANTRTDTSAERRKPDTAATSAGNSARGFLASWFGDDDSDD